MKTNRLFITVVLIITGSFFMNISAQEALKAIVKKCESMDNVNLNIVRNRDKETKKVTRVITSINFKDNEALKKEILSAFEKDRDMADKEIENRQSGRISNMFFRFGQVSYSFSESESGMFSLSVIENYSDKKDGAFFDNGHFFHNGLQYGYQADIPIELNIAMDELKSKFDSIDLPVLRKK